MEIIRILAGPLVGAVIGYFTNYIAVKMLFRPLHPVKIGSFTLPFTPGIIPGRKPQLAHAIGDAVGNNLLTNEDLENVLLSEQMKDQAVKAICHSMNSSSRSIRESAVGYLTEENYTYLRGKLLSVLEDKIQEYVEHANIADAISHKGQKMIKSKVSEAWYGFMVSDKMIAGIVNSVGRETETYLKENGRELLAPALERELEKMENQTMGETLSMGAMTDEKIPDMIAHVYTQLIRQKLSGFIRQFDLANVVETKINEMDVMEMERLVLSVMKHELNTIVSLGAIIGFVIGIVNVFI